MIRSRLHDVGLVKTRLRTFFTRHGLRVSVVLICLIFSAVLWTGLFVQMNIERGRIIESKRQENDNLARVFEEHIARTIRAAEVTLGEIASEYRRYGLKFDLVRYARDRGIYLDPYNILSIVDENGDLILANSPLSRRISLRETDSYQFHAQHDTPEIFSSLPRRGSTTGKWTVYLTRRINKADGSFGGLSAVGMDPSYFSRIYAELDLGKDSIVVLAGRDGIVRVRSSGASVTAGENVADTLLFSRYLPAASHGSFIGKGSVDQITRLLSYRALKDFPLVVLIGTSKAVALADYDQRRSRYLQATSAITAVILCLGLFALFQIARSERANEARRRSERLFRALAERSPVGIFRADAAGKCAYVNGRWCEIAGMRPEAALGDGWASALHPDDQERVFAEWTAAAKNRQPFLSEYRFQKADGTVTWVVGQARAETGPQSEVLGYVGTTTDITERRRSEEQAQLAHSLLQTVLDSTTDWIFSVDASYRFLFVNRAFAASQGFKPHNMIGRPDTDFWPLEYCIGDPAKGIRGFHPDDDEALAGRTVHNPADPATLADGTLRIFDTLKVPLRDDNGRIYGVLGYARDVTEQKRMEDALAASEMRLNEAQRIAQIGSWELDLVSNQLIWSDEIFRIFEIDRTKFGATYGAFLNAVHPEDREAVNEAYTNSLKTRQPYDITHRLLMAGGCVKYVHERCETHYNAAGEPLRSIGTVQDITERKRAEETIHKLNAELEQRVQERTAKLQAANKELETFSYSVAHDLRAPLRGIDGYSRLLQAAYSDKFDDQGRGFLHNIVHATQHMSQLIDDLLAYSRLERRDMQMGQVNPKALIESLLASRADEIKTRGVSVSVAIPFSSVSVDREGLVMALRNLLENALKFTRDVPQPMIEVSGRDTGATCVLAMRDNGVGFDMKFHDRIFDIFQRLHRSEDYPGTGVGLAIVRKAVERMGGRAWAESTPGKGATFYLEIPK